MAMAMAAVTGLAVDSAERAHARLRARTRDMHGTLDALPMALALAAGEIERAGYLRALQATEAGFSAIEEPARLALRGKARDFAAQWPARGALLHADIVALGGLPGVGGARAAHTPGGGAEALGLLYVLEGSLLGARVIWRRMNQSGAWQRLQPGRPLQFHALDQQRSVERWSCFLALLDDGLCEPADVEAACGAARRAFGEFIGNFGRAERG
jgi:heme oxygenase